MPPSHYQRGFTLLEGLAALTVLVSLLVLGAHYVQQRLEETLYQQAANQLRQVTAEAERYVRRHHDTLLPQYNELRRRFSTQASKLEACCSWQQLTTDQIKECDKQTAPLQPPTTQQTKKGKQQNRLLRLLGGTNIYQQSYAIFFNVHPPYSSHPASKNSNSLPPLQQLQVLVLTTDGQCLPDRVLRRVALQLGGAGGYIATHDPNVIMGSQGRWKVKILLAPPPEQRAVPPDRQPLLADVAASGHLAMVSLPNDESLRSFATQDLLHRRQLVDTVDTAPALNQMETDLLMQHHKIIFNNGATIGAQEMHLQHDSKGIHLHWQNNTPEISVIENGTSSVTLHPKSVKVNLEKQQQTSAQWLSPVAGYSGSELHAHWNKVPYYELKQHNADTLQTFTEGVCTPTHKGSEPLSKLPNWRRKKNNPPLSAGNESNLTQAIGRLFMLGFEKKEETRLYLCLGTGPVIVQQFPRPSDDKEAQGPPKGKRAAAKRGPFIKATPRLGNKGK